MISIGRTTMRNVKRWRDGKMIERWTAAGMLEAEKRFYPGGFTRGTSVACERSSPGAPGSHSSPPVEMLPTTVAQPVETPGWARYYDERFAQAAVGAAPAIGAYYESTARGREDRSLLDVACGTGQFALWFLERGYSVLGIDLSEHVLRHARERARSYVDEGRADFVAADATAFTLERSSGLATSLGNLVNLLADAEDVRRCFERVRAAVADGGTFVFDAVTRKGMWEGFNSVHVLETEEFLFVLRGIYHGGTEARSWVSGVVRGENGRWERFQEKKVITLFESDIILDLLNAAGWSTAWPAAMSDPATPLNDPDGHDRILFVAS